MARLQKTLKDDILRLRAEGKTYLEIETLLSCRRSTISYYCGDNQKEKVRNRTRKNRSTNPLIQKLDNCKRRTFERGLQNKVGHFHNASNGTCTSVEFNSRDLLEKVQSNPFCYLTGRAIDIMDSSSYHLDHVVPVSKGGDASLSNLGIACRAANQAKGNLSLEDFFKLCADVLIHNNQQHLIDRPSVKKDRFAT